jgi:ribosomal protein L16 Arg81 hydroxylase
MSDAFTAAAHGVCHELIELLRPFSCETFMREYWTRRLLHVAGTPDKFATLFPWAVLNETLERHRFQPNRLVLYKCGSRIDAARYLANADGEVDASAVMRECADGATLILNQCEEAYVPLRDLCSQLERLFHVRVYANVYAAFRADRGFDVHWDDQDTFILQVYGRKHWQMWEPTRTFPFRDDVVDTSPRTRPTGPPSWDGVLEQGSLLSVPRGWWHVAYPLDEPSLHLTITIKNLTGIDLLTWMVHQLKSSDHARMAVPFLEPPETQKTWLNTLWSDLENAWSPDFIGSFILDQDRRARSRPMVSLPDLSDPRVDDATKVQLAIQRPLYIQVHEGGATVIAGRFRCHVAVEVASAFERLNDGRTHTVGELSCRDQRALRALVSKLISRGVLHKQVCVEAVRS